MWPMVEELGGGILAGSRMVFVESSGKTSHIISHSSSISTMSFCRLAWKEEVVKVIEALIDQRVGRSVRGNKDLNGLRTGSLQWGWLLSLNSTIEV